MILMSASHTNEYELDCHADGTKYRFSLSFYNGDPYFLEQGYVRIVIHNPEQGSCVSIINKLLPEQLTPHHVTYLRTKMPAVSLHTMAVICLAVSYLAIDSHNIGMADLAVNNRAEIDELVLACSYS
jgi:hypothetical protein